ncbi:MAG: calcium/sodium antiporter [Bacteroidales bacterium]|nr:calcium/sodium antiporter [Bacteroidales bacterium]
MIFYIYLLAGLIILIAGGEFLVRGAVSLAGHFRISTMVVGVTVVSFGTSAPELVVSLDAALSGHPDISLGNVIGSNISNITLVLALAVIIAPYFVATRAVLKDWLIMIGATILFMLFLITGERLVRIEGIIMVFLLVLFVWNSVQVSRKESISGNVQFPEPRYGMVTAGIIIIISSGALVAGAELLVRGASGIAESYGVSERVISVSIIALGTSLPELATSAVAAIRKQNEISLGNIIGSNIFNLLAILGITSSIATINVADRAILTSDIWWMLGVSLLLMLLILPLRGSRLTRGKGAILILVYLTYIYLVFTLK